jgi:hypothetical protein
MTIFGAVIPSQLCAATAFSVQSLWTSDFSLLFPGAKKILAYLTPIRGKASNFRKSAETKLKD